MRFRHEPVERELDVNQRLDAIESEVRQVIAEGGEAALRARLERLLGKPAPRRRRRASTA